MDGDADRLVYFLVQPSSDRVDLVDGDKIMALFALFVKEQLSFLDENEDGKTNRSHHTRLGVVQTAYANGAATDYLKQLGLEVVFTPTGVKHLHEKAAEYDIGIYFEANGHGTILFSENYLCGLENRNNDLLLTSKGFNLSRFYLLIYTSKPISCLLSLCIFQVQNNKRLLQDFWLSVN